MIKQPRHINNQSKRQTAIALMVLLLMGFSACHDTKKVTEEPSIFKQRKPFKDLFHQANSEKMIGHYEKAIALFEECLSMEAENPAVLFALSDLYEKMGDKTKTLSYAEKAYQFQKENKWYALRLADLYFERNEFGKTADLYAKVISDEKNIDLKFRYTDALIKAGRFNEAVKMLDEIELETGKIPEVTFTKYDLLVGLGEVEKAEKELQDFIAENETDSDYKIMVAEFYMQQNKFDQSQKIVESILVGDPDYGQAYIMLADLELRRDNLTGAFSNLEIGFANEGVDFDRKLQILRGLIPYASSDQRDFTEMRVGIAKLFDLIYNPALKNSKLHEYYGFFWLTQENYGRAEKEYQIACDLDPGSFNTWLQLLDTQKKLENYQGLFSNGKKAAELFPAQPIIYLLTGIGAKEIKAYQEAEEWLFLGKDLVVKDNPLSSEFLYQLGDMNFMRQDTDEGKFYFDQALQVYPANVKVYADRAERFMESNNLPQAEVEIKKGLDVVPNSAKLLDVYGRILFQKKDYDGAKEAFLKALYENYQDGAILERCGDAFFLAGKTDEAIELWGDAIKYGNDSVVLKRKFDEKTYYKPE